MRDDSVPTGGGTPDSKIVAVEFVAEIRQVKTLVDKTVNIVLNLPEYCVNQAAWFMQHQGDMVKSVSTLDSLIKLDNETTTEEAKGSGSRVDSRRVRDRRDQRAGGKV